MVISVLLITAYILFTRFFLIDNKTEQSSLLVTPVNTTPASGDPLPDKKDNEQKKISLESTVKGVLEGTKGTYAVAVKNLKTGEAYYLNEHKAFKAGSLYKLWIMAVVYQQIQAGVLKEDQVLSEDIAVLNAKFNIGKDQAEQTEGTVTFTVRDALNQMITISHNYAALILTEKIRLSSAAKFLNMEGFNESAVGTKGDYPTTTAYDITLFFEKLYKGEFANEQYTNEMISLLKNQQLNDGIPKYLPDRLTVANKTGDIGQFKHDAGIIFSDKGDYILSVLSESDFPSAAQERIAGTSKAVCDYFKC